MDLVTPLRRSHAAPLLLALTALTLITLTGCVERALLIRSEPSGARVFLDGKDVGTTPTRVPFDFYGTREVMVRHEPTERGEGPAYAPETRLVPVRAPWFQRFPIDLLAEFAWPGTIVDEQVIEFTLVEHTAEELEEAFLEAARAHGLYADEETPTENATTEERSDR